MLSIVFRFVTVLSILWSGAAVKSWLTTADPSSGDVIKLLEEQTENSFKKTTNSSVSASTVEYQIDVDSKKQFILGYGAGLPQASAYVLNNLKSRNVELYNSVLQKLFGFDEDG